MLLTKHCPMPSTCTLSSTGDCTKRNTVFREYTPHKNCRTSIGASQSTNLPYLERKQESLLFGTLTSFSDRPNDHLHFTVQAVINKTSTWASFCGEGPSSGAQCGPRPSRRPSRDALRSLEASVTLCSCCSWHACSRAVRPRMRDMLPWSKGAAGLSTGAALLPALPSTWPCACTEATSLQ
jgi:hypothetical protein